MLKNKGALTHPPGKDELTCVIENATSEKKSNKPSNYVIQEKLSHDTKTEPNLLPFERMTKTFPAKTHFQAKT